MQALLDAEHAGDHDRRQDVGLPRHRGPARHARREPGHDPRERRAICREPGREVIYDAEHFFDGWKANPEYALQTIRAAAEAGRRDRRPVRHQRRQHARGSRRSSRARRSPSCRRAGGHPLPQRLRAGRGQLAGRRRRRRRAGAGHDQRLRRALRQRRPDLGRSPTWRSRSRATRCSAAERVEHLTELSRFVYEMVNMNFRDNQPFVGPERVRPQGRHARPRRRPGHRQLRAHRPGAGRQRAAHPGQRAVGPVEHRRPDQPSTTSSTTRS